MTLMLLAGAAVFVRGAGQCVRGAMTANGTPGKNLTWMRGFRGFIQGASIAAAGAGWWFGWPVMIAAAAIIILEETIETGIATWARQEFDAESGAGHVLERENLPGVSAAPARVRRCALRSRARSCR